MSLLLYHTLLMLLTSALLYPVSLWLLLNSQHCCSLCSQSIPVMWHFPLLYYWLWLLVDIFFFFLHSGKDFDTHCVFCLRGESYHLNTWTLNWSVCQFWMNWSCDGLCNCPHFSLHFVNRCWTGMGRECSPVCHLTAAQCFTSYTDVCLCSWYYVSNVKKSHVLRDVPWLWMLNTAGCLTLVYQRDSNIIHKKVSL